MTLPIDRLSSAPHFAVPAPSRGAFADHLQRAAQSLAAGDRALEAAIRSARYGAPRPEDLLALQATVYRYSQDMELASKLVDKATNGVQRVLQSP